MGYTSEQKKIMSLALIAYGIKLMDEDMESKLYSNEATIIEIDRILKILVPDLLHNLN